MRLYSSRALFRVFFISAEVSQISPELNNEKDHVGIPEEGQEPYVVLLINLIRISKKEEIPIACFAEEDCKIESI